MLRLLPAPPENVYETTDMDKTIYYATAAAAPLPEYSEWYGRTYSHTPVESERDRKPGDYCLTGSPFDASHHRYLSIGMAEHKVAEQLRN